MKKILFSLKTDFNGRSDAVGLPLLMLLYADFYSRLFNYKVEVFDPFFESHKYIKNYNFKIIKELDMNLSNYHRITNPLFYLSSLKVHNSNKVLEIEGKKNLKTKVNYKKNKIRLIQKTGLNNLEYLNKFSESKSLDIPYQYYLEWLFRDNFTSKIELKKKINLPLFNKDTFAIQFDYFFNRNPEFAINLINKIKEENNSSNIIVYGENKENYNDDVLKLLKNKNCIFLEDYSNNPLVKGIILGNHTNYYISKSNGFTDFAMTIGKHSKKLKKVFYADSVKNSNDIVDNVRRNLKNGILENKISKNSFFYNGVSDYYHGETILSKKNVFKKIKYKKKKSDKTFFIAYSTNTIENKFFSNFFDESINDEMLNDFNKSLSNSKLILFKNNKFYDFKSKKIIDRKKIKFEYASHILSHYKLINNEQNDKMLKGFLEFNNPVFLKKIIKNNQVNPGNLFYEDLFSYFIRKCSKKRFKSIDSQKKIKNILVLCDPDSLEKQNKYYNYLVKKFKIKIQDNDRYDWHTISNKVEKYFDCKLNFFYIKNNFLYLKKNNKLIKIKLSKDNLMKIFKNYENILCFPNELSLMARFLSTDKNNLIFLGKNNMKKNLIDHSKILFTNNFEFKYSDLFDMKFVDLTELFLFLFKEHKKI